MLTEITLYVAAQSSNWSNCLVSCTLFPYVVDIAALQRCVGSQDKKLFAQVASNCAGRIKQNEESFEGDIRNGAPNLRVALEQIIQGSALQDRWAFQYPYALELLCGHLGLALDNRFFQETRGDWMQRVGVVLPLLEWNAP